MRNAAIAILIIAPGIWLFLFLSWVDAMCRTRACKKYQNNIKTRK